MTDTVNPIMTQLYMFSGASCTCTSHYFAPQTCGSHTGTRLLRDPSSLSSLSSLASIGSFGIFQSINCAASKQTNKQKKLSSTSSAVKEKEDLHPDVESQEMNDDTFCEYR